MFKKILIGMSLLLVVGLLFGCNGVKQEDLDAAKAQANTLQNEVNNMQGKVSSADATKAKEEANKALVRRYYDIVNLSDMKGYEDLLSSDYQRYVSDGTPPIDGDGNKKRLLGFHAVFPGDFHLEIIDIVAEGDLVTVHNTFTGTQKAPFLGIPPADTKVKLWDVEVFRIENGKIAKQWGGPDIFDGVMQMGGVPIAKSQLTALQEQMSAADAAKAKEDANKALVISYFQALGKGDLNALDTIFSPDYKRYLTATAPPLNVAAQKQRLAGLKAVFPDLSLTIDSLIVGGDYVTVRMTATGTQEVAFMGIPATGQQFTVTAIEIIRIENGKMVEHWGGTDNLDLLQQLGAVITAGE